MKIGRVVKAQRQAHGMTQVQLAKRARISQSYVASLESGKRHSVSLAVLQRLARALRVSVGTLVGG